MQKLFIAGHRGMVGSSLVREAARRGGYDVVTATREVLDLCNQAGLTYHSAMPTNLYGPGDNYHPENSHVIPALLRRFHEAQQRGDSAVTIWGTGTPRREFLHVDDLAAACFHLLSLEVPPDWVNLGVGVDLTIFELATLVARTTGFTGAILTDPKLPAKEPNDADF
ncbi:MAG: NAD-dependent epimerase/dehydratase family protein [Verrucomicrobia bacterium]|nr:NAD-dependent epimerase/dehydratase family protein [Verrucomicrobiota bacterium]